MSVSKLTCVGFKTDTCRLLIRHFAGGGLLDARPSDDGSRLALLILVDEIVERFSVDRLIVFERCRVILDAEDQ